ncbi:hypothetical protein RMATCC62417_01033 [Rhizopus microsporus]|nr:hypothetical protein RMATCC62417_01033 [Rhizopus microsporus]
MNSIQSVYHSSFDHPSLANDEWINHYQQKELERLRQVQHQAALQQQRALMHQQMLYYHQQQQQQQQQQQPQPQQQPAYIHDYYYYPQQHYMSSPPFGLEGSPNMAEKAQKRAEHNAIERQRREVLNTKFQQLALSLPNLQHDRRPSKGTIIERTLEYVKQTVQKEQEFKYQIDQLRKANRTLFLQMASLSDDDLEDDDEQISNTPEGDCDDTFSCKSSITSSPTLSDLPILMTTDFQNNNHLIV